MQVDDASTANWTGVDWFKIAEEGLDTTTGKWAVDSMIAGDCWWNFTIPVSVTAGQYLPRVKLIVMNVLSLSVILRVLLQSAQDS